MKESSGIIRLPTKTPFAFIEMHLEGTTKELVEAYNEINEAYWGQGSEGLDKKTWNACLDKYIQGGSCNEEEMTKMSEKQQWMIHEIDKSFSRINNKK